MKRTILTILVIVIAAAGLRAQNPATPDETYMFAQRDTCDLYLDFYKSPSAKADAPTVVYVFGGGFKNGTRDKVHARTWFTSLLDKGWNVASIDYRLGLKGVKDAGVSKAFIDNLKNAIDIAVEDLYSATAYLVENADALGIDPERIVISGSSAGAITVLQAEWYRSRGYSIADTLPDGFHYAGVMGFSGAVLSLRGKARFGADSCPIAMFHGTDDKIVPYSKIAVLTIHFDGSSQLAKYFRKTSQPYRIYRIAGHTHEIADSMNYLTEQVESFIEEDVIKGLGTRLDETVENSPIPIPEWAKADYKSLYD